MLIFNLSSFNFFILVAINLVLKIPLVWVLKLAEHLNTPWTSILSPGLILSTRSSTNTTSIERGRRPVGAVSGSS